MCGAPDVTLVPLRLEGDLNIYKVGNVQGVQLKSEPYFNISNLFTKFYNMLYYTTNPNLQ